MGQVISASASADDIFSDVETTYVRATARGGAWQTLANQRLGNVRGVIGNVQSRLNPAQAEAAPLAASVAAQDHHADRLIGHAADTIWNAIGHTVIPDRPRSTKKPEVMPTVSPQAAPTAGATKAQN